MVSGWNLKIVLKCSFVFSHAIELFDCSEVSGRLVRYYSWFYWIICVTIISWKRDLFGLFWSALYGILSHYFRCNYKLHSIQELLSSHNGLRRSSWNKRLKFKSYTKLVGKVSFPFLSDMYYLNVMLFYRPRLRVIPLLCRGEKIVCRRGNYI